MKHSVIALARRLAVELLLLVYAAALAAMLMPHAACLEVMVVLTWAPVVALGAAWAKLRAGTLRLAWSCPRVDALELPLPRTPEAWRAAISAESVLAALEGEARVCRDFFPDAHGDVRLALHGALTRGVAAEDVDAVTARFEEIAVQLRQVRVLHAGPSALEPLDALAARSSALADAVEELVPRAQVVPLRSGGRS